MKIFDIRPPEIVSSAVKARRIQRRGSASLRRGCKAAVRRGKKMNSLSFSLLLYSISRRSVELRDTNTSVWLLCVVYVVMFACAVLLTIHEGSPSKGGFHGTHGTHGTHH